MATFKEWLELDEADNSEKVKGSLEKLIDIMTGKKDTKSKEILKQAKGTLKKFNKDGGISPDSAEWLANTWASMKFQ